MIDSLDTALLTANIAKSMRDAPELGGDHVLIERSEAIPEQVDGHGWVGIYRESQSFPIIAAGMGQGGRNHSVTVLFVIKNGDLSSGAECEDNLGNLEKRVIDHVLNGGSFGGLVDFAQEVRTQYARYDKDEGGRFTQTAYIFVTFERRI